MLRRAPARKRRRTVGANTAYDTTGFVADARTAARLRRLVAQRHRSQKGRGHVARKHPTG